MTKLAKLKRYYLGYSPENDELVQYNPKFAKSIRSERSRARIIMICVIVIATLHIASRILRILL